MVSLSVFQKYSKYIMYEVNYNSRMSCVSNQFYCHVRPEGLLRDLLALSVFLVQYRQTL